METMTIDRFWSVVELARQRAKEKARGLTVGRTENDRIDECIEDALYTVLSRLPSEEVAGFEDVFNRLHNAAYHHDLWAAAYIMNGGCSDDGFIDFRYQLIMKGRHVYEEAIRDAQTLTSTFVGGYEGVQYVPNKVYKEKTGREIPYGQFAPPAKPYRREPEGEQWKENDLPVRFPKLWAKYWH
jgi:hypothetical protein